MNPKFTNDLIHESSPYLLQHAHNPVQWKPWGQETLEKAREENRLLLVSIGYAACHWCHVMERECFEDEEVAGVMNAHFIPVKVDREERPDVDQVYMDALQLMTGGGGWPLNVVALPDGRPFWGATYVKKADWMQVLTQLADLYRQDPARVEGYAENLKEGLEAINAISPATAPGEFSMGQLEAMVEEWKKYFDTYLGGYKRAPKFMMPVNLGFFLHYAHRKKDHELMDYVNTTLTKMAWGGIFDPIAGGFSRYSVDVKWHVPHFEKMLYDNAQLISLYSQAFAATKNSLYRETAEKCIAFVRNELMSASFGFYASLDADSLNESGQLEEGAFYVWRETELKNLLGDDYDIFKTYFNINSYGHWEDGKYVLIRDAPAAEVAKKHTMGEKALKTIIGKCLQRLGRERARRDRPRLDDKVLTSWNGLMLKALTDAYRYLGKKEYLDLALKNAAFLQDSAIRGGNRVSHTPTPASEGYLEDYACLIDAFIGLYEVTFNEEWLRLSGALVDTCVENYFEEGSGLFYFTSKQAPVIVRRTLETSDNVIPASNSIMARNIYRLSRYFPETAYTEIASRMLGSMRELIEKHPQNHACWLQLALWYADSFYEVAITGKQSRDLAVNFHSEYLPNTVLAGSSGKSELPLLEGRWVPEKSLIYLCTDGSCKLPEEDPARVLRQLIPE